jgi:hypothetical protein
LLRRSGSIKDAALQVETIHLLILESRHAWSISTPATC